MAASGIAFSPLSYQIAILPLAAALIAANGGCGGSNASGSAMAPRAAASGPPVQLPHARPLFIPGETMAFELTFRNVIAGRAVIAVGVPGQVEGRQVLIVRSLLESAGLARWFKTVRDDVNTQVDVAQGIPIEHRADMTFGDKHTLLATRFPPGQVVMEYERNGGPRHTKRVRMPPGEQVHDFHSALGALRAWMPAVGDAVYYHSASGRRIWRIELRCTGSETTRTAMGMYPALRFEGTAVRLDDRLQVDGRKPPRQFTFWLSDDDSRMPLLLTARTEYGEVAAELVDYQRPDRNVSMR